MKITSTFKHLEHTEALDERIEAKSLKLKKYFEGKFEIFWTCSAGDDGQHTAEIKLLGPSFEYHATAHSENLYKTLDLVISKIEKQVHKKKDKWKNNISKKDGRLVKEQFITAQEREEEHIQSELEDGTILAS